MLDGFVFAPLHKAAFKLGGHDFPDEHQLFAHYLECSGPFGEMNVLNNLWTSRVTSHIPLKDVSARLSISKIIDAIKLAHVTLTKAGYDLPKIAIAAVNPHSGESGTCGKEEIEIIQPAVIKCQDSGINVSGPYSADTVFIKAFKGEFDAVVTMYHDQGQIALKLMGFEHGVTICAGLPYPITTPAHGTAFDIVGKGIADHRAMEQAVIIAAKMAGWRP
ncbi:MAG: 4-hydroxythreonine-4-phosphate dehydrogenase PdxA [Desulfitobacterium hafniense]|nr:4-hydroxythreonine-4-phosphate dehydrogenase PdxA [Desulfitobacterium hafniense]